MQTLKRFLAATAVGFIVLLFTLVAVAICYFSPLAEIQFASQEEAAKTILCVIVGGAVYSFLCGASIMGMLTIYKEIDDEEDEEDEEEDEDKKLPTAVHIYVHKKHK